MEIRISRKAFLIEYLFIIFFLLMFVKIQQYFLLALAITIFLYTEIKRINVKYKITSENVVEEKGIFNKKITEIKIKDISGIEIYQSFFDRTLNIGSIGISVLGLKNAIKLEKVSNPKEIAKILKEGFKS